MNERIESDIKNLPTNSGVYLMHDKRGTIIYVGKAKNLKNRVSQYFYKKGNSTAKVMAMVAEIEYFEYIITPTEVDALMLENNLIKEHKPYYNILLKDDKQYPFLQVTLNEKFPRLLITRRFTGDKSKYFGPYMNGINIKNVLEVVNKAFCLRTCNLNFDKIPSSHRPCLNYHIGRCNAPCAGYVTPQEYKNTLNLAIDFLRGNDSEILARIKEKMMAASNAEDYETALAYKNDYTMIQRINRKQIAYNPKDFNLDVFSVTSDERCLAIGILIVRSGKILGGDTYVSQSTALTDAEALSQFIMQYYEKNLLQVAEIMVNETLPDRENLSSILGNAAEKKVQVIKPIQGTRFAMVEMALANAKDACDKASKGIVNKQQRTASAAQQLADCLGLTTLNRMECYDNSNLSGTNAVSSMVVFEGGVPLYKHYRRFKVKTVVGADDFATMKEILTRRFLRYKEGLDESYSKLPDLIIVDGGKGQLSSAVAALDELGISVNIVGLAKKQEEIFLPHLSTPVILPLHSPAYHLVQRIRDEAHRFAITYHRSTREKQQTESALKEIKGVGDAAVKKLFAAFKSMHAIKTATLEELVEAGINRTTAQNIIDFYKEVE